MLRMSGINMMTTKKRSQKGLVKDSDVNSRSRRGNHSTDAVGLPSDEDNDGGSSGNLGPGVEATDGVTKSESEDMNNDVEDQQHESKERSRVSDESCSPPVHAPPESDVEEEDVKVCDICGDAGREELLAVCSRCSDGAEHTYCMREKLDKVPEEDWLCEECKCNELLEARKLDHSKKLGSHERSKFLGRTSSLLTEPSVKDGKELSLERPKPRNLSLDRQTSSKRCGEKMDSCPTAKKQAFESSMGSPTRSSPRQTAVISKDVSCKMLDKSKGKPSSLNCTGAEFTGDSSENARSPTVTPHVPKGNFMKSNSFSSSNSKQNGKLSEAAHQKQGYDAKEGMRKLISKSMSFKGLGRSSLIEPKVKMLPSKSAPAQDLKGPKNGKDRSSFERKTTMKLDHAFPGQVTANSTKRSSGGSDSISPLSVTNTRDYKNAQTDGKLSNTSKHAIHLSHKTSDTMTSSGESKKLSSTGAASTSVNGTSNALETKLNQFSVKDGSLVSSLRSSDGLASADEGRADGQGNQSEKAPEKNSGHSRQSLNNGMVSGSRRKIQSDASTSKTKQGLHDENKLKAAIEAAMQKKQDLFKKQKISEKPNELPVSNTEAYPGGDGVPIQIKDPMSEEAMHEGDVDLHEINLNSLKQLPVSGSKPIKLYPGDFEKSSVGESNLSVSAIPEQESVWQGGFEIHRNGKHPEMCGEFQAHMSIFASGKVLEMLQKFPNKMIVNEVPRPSAWPIHFKALGVREDNIALYFFAKDSESYMRSYKILVDYMMKHDLALRGTIDGVELLLFPSNHLPHKSKCWNTLYYIWGVFRGRRLRSIDDRSCSLMKCESSVSDVVTLDKNVKLAENPCLYKPAEKELSELESVAHVIGRSSLHQCDSLSNGDCYEECSVSGRCLDSPIGSGDPKKSSKNHYTSLREACPESESADLREQCQLNPNMILNHPKSMGEKNLPPEVALDKQDGCLPTKLPLICKQKGESVVNSAHLHLLDDNNHIKKVKPENSVKQESRCLVNMLKSGQVAIDKTEDTNNLLKNGAKLISDGDLRSEGYVDINVSANNNFDDLHGPPCSPKRHFQEDSFAASSIANDSLACKEEFGKFSGCDLNGRPPFSDEMEVQMGGVSSISQEHAFDEADGEKLSARHSMSHLIQDFKPGDDSLSQEMALSENADRLPSESPNLELALGVKRKQAGEGLLRFFGGAIDRKDLDMSPDVLISSKKEDEDASASLSLSLGFAFPDKL